MTQVHLTSEELFLTHNREVQGELGRRILAHLSSCGECEKKLADFSKIETLFQKRNFEEPSAQTINRILQKAGSPSLAAGVAGSVEAVKAWWKSWVVGLGLTGAMAGLVFALYPQFQPTPTDQALSPVAAVGSEAATEEAPAKVLEKTEKVDAVKEEVPATSVATTTLTSDSQEKKAEVNQPAKKKVQSKPKPARTQPLMAKSSSPQVPSESDVKSTPIKIKGVNSLVSLDDEVDAEPEEKPAKKDWTQSYLNKARNYAAKGSVKSADVNYRSAYRSAKTESLKKTILAEWVSFLEKNGKTKQAQKKTVEMDKKSKSSTKKF